MNLEARQLNDLDLHVSKRKTKRQPKWVCFSNLPMLVFYWKGCNRYFFEGIYDLSRCDSIYLVTYLYIYTPFTYSMHFAGRRH